MKRDKKNIELVIEFLNREYDFRYNEVTNQTEYKQKESLIFKTINDKELSTIYVNCNHHVFCTQHDLKSYLQSNRIKVFNPFYDYLNSLPKWDKISYISKLAKTVKTQDDSYFEWCFEKWIVGVVATMINDDVTNHQCMILAGPQGIGKSTWVDNLVPHQLKRYYYSGNIDLKNKDTLYNLSSKFLINLDELANLTYKSVTQLKEIVTKGNISYRKVYGHFDDNYIRRASFIGSVNGLEFLYDLTGNRRFLSNEIISFENSGRHNINMDLVFAEAFYKYKNGFKYWFDEDDQVRVEEHNKAFLVVTAEEELLLKHFSPSPISIERLKDMIGKLDSYSKSEKEQLILDYIPYLNVPVYLTATEIYSKTIYHIPTRGDIPKFGKIINRCNFIRTKKGDRYVYKVYANSVFTFEYVLKNGKVGK